MRQLRYKFAVVSSLFYVPFYAVPKSRYYIRHREKYTVEDCYRLARRIMDFMRRRSRTETVAYGKENLPKEGSYIMYSNHQGKYDALGILLTHDDPCAVLWEMHAARRFPAREVNGLLRGKEIDLGSLRASVRAINEVAREVSEGRKYLIFPEGGYKDNGNNLQEFKDGCFLCALKSHAPIVPVAIYDSYRAMDTNTFEKVTTEVHYLEPIGYEVYGTMKRNEIAALVKSRISDKIDEIAERTKQKENVSMKEHN